MTKLRTNFRMAGSGLLVLVIALLTFSTALFAQELIWAKGAGGTGGDFGRGIAVDGLGNSYVTGYFPGTATFGAGETNQTTLTSAGENDIFIAKYNSDGTLAWAKNAGGTSYDHGTGIAVDRSGNSYVTGGFSFTATFGLGEANQTSLTSARQGDIFIAKYNSDGTLAWAKKAVATNLNASTGIAVERSGNSYLTGFFSGTATFGAGEANQTPLTSAGDSDIFVAKYNSEGTLAWAKKAGGTSGAYGRGIAVDGSGNSYVTGSFDGTATFGLGEANQTSLTSAGDSDMFVAKYNSDGTLAWAKNAGGTGNDLGSGIAVDGSGNSYLTGVFYGTATFGLGEAKQTSLTSAGLGDIFVAKYNSDGTLAWVKGAGGTGGDGGNGIAVDGLGNSYVTGYFSGTATFGLGEANETTLTNVGSGIFVAKYNSDGTLAWAKIAGGTGYDLGSGIAVDRTGNSYVRGIFEGTATFGLGEANQTSLTSAGGTDIFVAKFSGKGHVILNHFVSFAPISSSFNTTANVSGCPAGFVGKFSFNARLTDKITSPSVSDLTANVATLTNGNLLQNADGGPGGVGASLTIAAIGSYADGVLSPIESVDVPFVICLKNRSGFSFFVDVLGIAH